MAVLVVLQQRDHRRALRGPLRSGLDARAVGPHERVGQLLACGEGAADWERGLRRRRARLERGRRRGGGAPCGARKHLAATSAIQRVVLQPAGPGALRRRCIRPGERPTPRGVCSTDGAAVSHRGDFGSSLPPPSTASSLWHRPTRTRTRAAGNHPAVTYTPPGCSKKMPADLDERGGKRQCVGIVGDAPWNAGDAPWNADSAAQSSTRVVAHIDMVRVVAHTPLPHRTLTTRPPTARMRWCDSWE